jgi:hypothetical protein
MRLNFSQTKRDVMLAACAARGIKVTKHEHFYTLVGHGINVRVADLNYLDEMDLTPAGGGPVVRRRNPSPTESGNET